MFISVVSPVYKAKNCLSELCTRVSSVLGQISSIEDFEIILVEDGSEDGTWEEIKKISSENRKIKAIRLSRNFGQQKAITAGLNHASGDWIIVMDCDLQDIPEDIPVLLDKAKEGYDVVCATREKRNDRFWRSTVSKLWYFVFRHLSGLDLDAKVRNYRIISKKVLLYYNKMCEESQSFLGQVHWLGFNTAYLELSHGNRFEGKSSYNLFKLLKFGFTFIVAYSNKPLIFSIYIGFFISAVSLIIAIYVFLKSIIIGVPVQGWASLMLSMWFLGGVIIANLGVLGVYIGRILIESQNRPLYVVSELLNISDKEIS